VLISYYTLFIETCQEELSAKFYFAGGTPEQSQKKENRRHAYQKKAERRNKK